MYLRVLLLLLLLLLVWQFPTQAQSQKQTQFSSVGGRSFSFTLQSTVHISELDEPQFNSARIQPACGRWSGT